jgi:hypothetical protein
MSSAVELRWLKISLCVAAPDHDREFVQVVDMGLRCSWFAFTAPTARRENFRLTVRRRATNN